MEIAQGTTGKDDSGEPLKATRGRKKGSKGGKSDSEGAKGADTKGKKEKKEMSDRDKTRNQASALEGRIRARLESAENLRKFKMHNTRLHVLIPFIRDKMGDRNYRELIGMLEGVTKDNMNSQSPKLEPLQDTSSGG